MRRFALGVIATMFASAPAAFGSIIYGNTTTDTLDTLAYAANGFTQIGDQIQLAGTDRLATLAVVQFFSDGSAGTFDATLRLFNVGAPVGSQIGSDFVVTGISVAGNPSGDVVTVSFVLPDVLVPNTLVFTVAVGSFSAGVDILGLNMFEPPTIGSSDNTFAIANNGSSFLQTATANEDVYFQLDAISASVPEPATLGIVGAGLLLLGLRRRRSG